MRHLIIGLFTACCVSCATASGPTDSLPTAAAAPAPVITRLVYRHQTIVVRSGDNGPTYALESNDGRPLTGQMTLNQIAVHQPQALQKIKQSQANLWAGMD